MNEENKILNYIGYCIQPICWIGGPPASGEDPAGYQERVSTDRVFEKRIITKRGEVDFFATRDGHVFFGFESIQVGTTWLKRPFVSEPDTLIPFPASFVMGRKSQDDGLFHCILQLMNVQYLSLVLSCMKSFGKKMHRLKSYAIRPFDIQIWSGKEGNFSASLDRTIETRRARMTYLFGKNNHDLDSFVTRSLSPSFSVEAIETSIKCLESIMNDPEYSTKLDLVMLQNKCMDSFYNFEYETALIISWTGLEQFISDLWTSYLETRKVVADASGNEIAFISRERMNSLSDSRVYSAATIIEILSLMGKIDFEFYKRITLLRKCRNAWIHRLAKVSQEDAACAVNSLLSVLENAYRIRFTS